MRLTRTILGFTAAACFCFTLTSASAEHGPAPKTAPALAKPTANGPSTATTTTKTSGNSPTKHTTSSSTSPSMTGHGQTSTKRVSTTTSSTSGTTSTKTMNPIATKIASKPQLNAKISTMLPDGVSLNRASRGFKNQGQFIAALHAAQRCGQPNCFSLIKTDMTKNGMSLGQAIQDVKKTSTSKADADATKAQHEADDDVKSTTPSTSKKPRTDGDHDRDDTEHHEVEHHDQPHTIARSIASSPQLKTKVQALLPTGMPLADAAKNFRSESQFLAALHASKDLKIPFAQIKAEMTGNDHDSLTRAIQELKPSIDAGAAAQTAQKEAAADLKSTATAATNHAE
jgi:hypothetical protein